MADLFEFVCSADLDKIEESVRINLNRRLPEPPWGSATGVVSICANGPSLRTVFPTVGAIASLNGSWRSLVDCGVMPTYIVAYDPTPQNISWFKDAPKEPIYLLGSRLPHEAFELLTDHKVFIWHLLDDLEHSLGATNMVYGGPSVGLHAMNLMAALGYTHMHLYGYDSCYANGQHHATKQDWGITQPEVYSVGNHVFVAERWMAAQCQEFFKLVEANRKEYTVDVVSPGMLQALVKFAWGGRTHNKATLEAVYDLDVAPGSFDFLWAMLNIENYRKVHGYRNSKVHFRAGSDKGFRPNELIDVSHEHKNGMLNNVVRPMLKMFDMEEVSELQEGEYVTCTYSPIPTIEGWKATGYLPTYHASEEATEWAQKHYKDVVTITLREAHYWTQRNSNLEEWLKFADYLRGEERVVVIRDTAKAGESFGDHEVCAWAAVDIDRRLALYRAAKMNMFVTNGPVGLAWCSTDIPYITMWKKAPGYGCYDDAWMRSYLGWSWGDQFPWYNSEIQANVWKDDTFENILEAYRTIGSSQRVAA